MSISSYVQHLELPQSLCLPYGAICTCERRVQPESGWADRLNWNADSGQDFQNAISSLSACRVPVIAALHGIALGLAIDIACACDVRLAAENAVFAIAVRLYLPSNLRAMSMQQCLKRQRPDFSEQRT